MLLGRVGRRGNRQGTETLAGWNTALMFSQSLERCLPSLKASINCVSVQQACLPCRAAHPYVFARLKHPTFCHQAGLFAIEEFMSVVAA